MNPTRTFALGTFSVAGSPPFVGLLIDGPSDGRVIALHALEGSPARLGLRLSGGTMLALLDEWERNLDTLGALVEALADPAHAAIAARDAG